MKNFVVSFVIPHTVAENFKPLLNSVEYKIEESMRGDLFVKTEVFARNAGHALVVSTSPFVLDGRVVVTNIQTQAA